MQLQLIILDRPRLEELRISGVLLLSTVEGYVTFSEVNIDEDDEPVFRWKQ